jgi:HK97 family phage major capsid protein
MSNLLKTRNEVYSQMKNIMDIASDKRSEGDYAKFDALENEYNKLTKQIEAEVRFDAINGKMGEVLDKRAINSKTGPSEDEYRSAFLTYVRTGNTDELRQLNSFSTSEGGVNVPVILLQTIQRTLLQNSVMRRIGARTIQTTSTTTLPIVGSGVTAVFKDQNPSASYSETDVSFSSATLGAYKATALIKVSEELLQDASTDLESTLAAEMGIGFGNLEEKAFVSGSGTNEPRGILRYTTAGGNAALSQNLGSSTGSALLDNMIAAYYKMPGNRRQEAVWIVGDGLASQMRQLKASTAGTYLWEVSVQAGQPDLFLGRPVYTTYAAPATWQSTTGVMGALLYPQHFVIGDRGGYSLQRLNELYAAEGNIGWRAHKRFDSALTDGNSLVKLVANVA